MFRRTIGMCSLNKVPLNYDMFTGQLKTLYP